MEIDLVLKEAAEDYCKSTLVGSPYVKKNAFKAGAKWQQEREYTCYEEAFEDGAKWKNEQLMAKAIDGTARPDDNEIWCNLASSNLKDGDKVKVIVIKGE